MKVQIKDCMDDLKKVRSALDNYVLAKSELTKLGVLRSERTIGEYGEWFAEELTGAIRDSNTSRKGYDLVLGDRKIQIKSHAKGDKNNARWTQWPYSSKVFDELIILVFNKELYLKEAYHMTYEQAFEKIDLNLKQRVLKWDNYQEHRIDKFPDVLERFIYKTKV